MSKILRAVVLLSWVIVRDGGASCFPGLLSGVSGRPISPGYCPGCWGVLFPRVVVSSCRPGALIPGYCFVLSSRSVDSRVVGASIFIFSGKEFFRDLSTKLSPIPPKRLKGYKFQENCILSAFYCNLVIIL